MKKIIFFIIFSVISCKLHSQKIITGQVFDIEKRTVEGVKIFVKNTSIETVTDSNGYFILEIPEETKKITFQKEDYIELDFEIESNNLVVTILNQEFDIYELSLSEIMNMKVEVASPKARTVIEMPGIITLITDEDIKKSGARDLLDLLRNVPGFNFAAELDHVTGIGIRGNNSTEGKFLLMIDNQQMNETNYGSFDFGQHIQLNNIKRIEIIRGPGSAIYGGIAELAVINIITKTGNDYNGFSMSANSSYSHGGILANNIQFGSGKKFNNDFEFSLTGYGYFGNKSNLKVNTFNGDILNYADSSAFKSYNLNFGFNYKSLTLKYIYDNKNFNNLQKRIGDVLFSGHYLGIEYNWDLNNKLTIVPKLNWKMQKPWHFINFSDYSIYNTINNRYTLNVTSIYEYSQKLNFVYGIEYFIDNGKKQNDTIVYISNNKNETSYSTTAVFVETNIFPRFANFTLGARLDYHNQYGYAFVPRFAMTKIMDKIHSKFMFSKAFKAPTLQNIDINPNIKPEISNVAEIELGYSFTKNMMLNINFFSIDISNAIVYLWADNKDHYLNYEKTGSKGFEIEHKILEKSLNLNFGYSFYLANKNNKVPDYEVEGHSTIFGAYPNHKISLTSTLKLTEKLIISPSLLFYSERYIYFFDENWNPVLKKFNSTILTNLFLEYSDLFIQGIDLSFGLYDIFDSKFAFINAYKAGVEPICEPGREFLIKICYELKK